MVWEGECSICDHSYRSDHPCFSTHLGRCRHKGVCSLWGHVSIHWMTEAPNTAPAWINHFFRILCEQYEDQEVEMFSEVGPRLFHRSPLSSDLTTPSPENRLALIYIARHDTYFNDTEICYLLVHPTNRIMIWIFVRENFVHYISERQLYKTYYSFRLHKFVRRIRKRLRQKLDLKWIK